jgi:flagellar biosynthesis chaperone FliJ
VTETAKKGTPINEEMVNRYHRLNEEAKQIESELKQLKQIFNTYFDQTVGKNTKGETYFGDYKLQRQIRQSERYIDDKTIQKLEQLNMTDCIETIKRPDSEKINAAVKLGLLSSDDLEDCITRKVSKAIVVRETK